MGKPPEMTYGTPSSLSSEDREWFGSLDRRAWNESRDRLGHVHRFPKGGLSSEDEDKVLSLIASHCLPCVLGSGPYGGLFFRVFDHSDHPGVKPDCIAVLDEEHFGRFGAGSTFKEWPERFSAISLITHSGRNREILAFYGLPEPGPASQYDY